KRTNKIENKVAIDFTESSIRKFPTDAIIPSSGYYLWANKDCTDLEVINADETSGAAITSNNSIALFNDNNAIIDQIAWGIGHINPFIETFAVDVSGFIKDMPEIIERQNFQDTGDNSTDFKITTTGSPTSSGCLENPSKCLIEPEEATNLSNTIFITELFPNPDSNDAEYIEIYNNGEALLNLSGWELRDATKTGHYTFTMDENIETKKYLVVYKTKYKFALNNSGSERVSLFDPTGKEVSFIEYAGSQKGFSYSLNGTDWKWTKFLTPGKENKFEKKLKVIIVKIKANPKGKDTDKTNGEELYLKNTSKKKVNLKTWSLATGSKTLYNHPITKDFVIKPGKTKKITRKYSLFTLNNKKGVIELRYPNGEVASRVKYDKKKESVKDDEVYELTGKKWQWIVPPEEILTEEIIPAENPGDINLEIELEISNEELSLNLGKYSSENKLALIESSFAPARKNLLQSRENPGIVLGAFSTRGEIRKPVEIKSTTSWNKALQKSNQFFNLLINRIVHLI
ncbi:lamin tail domain-containing protein, partial [Patescibacteria group bacterium]|nr:lamin tail domain-containing protein [Patescibacteria group bacterium]